jgi:hypothetical protein
MEIRRGAGHRMAGEVAPRPASSVDRIGVRDGEIRRETIESEARVALPAWAFSHGRELDREIARDEPPSTREAKCQVMAVWAELELEVALVRADEEELDDLEFPEPHAGAGR